MGKFGTAEKIKISFKNAQQNRAKKKQKCLLQQLIKKVFIYYFNIFIINS